MNRYHLSNCFDTSNLVIATGASLSASITCGGLRLSGIITPSSWTANTITFQASLDGTNFFNVYDAGGNEYTLNVSASRYIILDIRAFYSIPFLKIRAGTSSSPSTQSVNQTVSLLFGGDRGA